MRIPHRRLGTWFALVALAGLLGGCGEEAGSSALADGDADTAGSNPFSDALADDTALILPDGKIVPKDGELLEDSADAESQPDSGTEVVDTDAPGSDAGDASDIGDAGTPDGSTASDSTGADAVVGDPGPTPLSLDLVAEREGGPFGTTWHVEIDSDGLYVEEHAPATPHVDATVIEQFGGNAEPPPSEILVHGWPGWDTLDKPVLLVHGTGGWASLTFADPTFGIPGLATALINGGHAVFAITFPHPVGDLRNQAAQVAAAAQWVRMQRGEPQLDIVAHSKGGIAAASYVAGMAAKAGFSFASDVEHLVLLGTPLGGMDYTFRHPVVGASASFWGFPVPSPWEATYAGLLVTDTFDKSIYHPGYLGLQQLLWPWIDEYGLSMLEQDWYTTYHGGTGFVSESRGIDETVALGGHYMEKLWSLRVPASVKSAIGAGGTAIINGVLWETDGPSDGLVFVSSAVDTTIFAAPDAVVVREFLLTNHPGLVLDPSVHNWITDRLADVPAE